MDKQQAQDIVRDTFESPFDKGRFTGFVRNKDVVYLDLELPSDINKLQDAELYLSRFKDTLGIIDEVQRMPSLFPLLRACGQG